MEVPFKGSQKSGWSMERPNEKDDGYLDPHGKDNFNRVETDSGGHIIVHV